MDAENRCLMGPVAALPGRDGDVLKKSPSGVNVCAFVLIKGRGGGRVMKNGPATSAI